MEGSRGVLSFFTSDPAMTFVIVAASPSLICNERRVRVALERPGEKALDVWRAAQSRVGRSIEGDARTDLGREVGCRELDRERRRLESRLQARSDSRPRLSMPYPGAEQRTRKMREGSANQTLCMS